MTDRWTAETEELVARTLAVDTWDDVLTASERATFRYGAQTILTALADAGLLLPAGGETRQDVIDEGRALAAAAILAHADKHAPKDGNEAQRRLRRHLEIAARVAASPITMAQLAEALTEHFGGQP